jgi:type III secretory pathway component EscS
VTALEDRLRDALSSGTGATAPSRDLFTRVRTSIEEDRARRRQRRRAAALGACVVGAVASLVVAVTDVRGGRLLMDWWILELLTNAALVALALWLGPFIKRFGRSYAADVFRANPGTGKSFIVLTDFAYYLIFLAYILFTISFEPKGEWDDVVNAAQLQHETARVAGIVLIIGILHGFNLVALPVIGRLLTLNRRLDESTPPGPDDV